ncbi:hypothetical protein E5161_05185 [Cohnella pontilimi]|uniref:VanZ-like domain-containing protein n=1 Tax=Cohnella pontilimi TaxID=2564100 RepID=A0A4U0FIL7_9BACL|nr:VanZ family protein [Cohnella pontilimi]TJY43292.1 hypothetical protein E5161_05185 [Cohnella pontilimi]
MSLFSKRRGLIPGFRWRRCVPAVVWMAVIFALSSRSGGQLNEWLPFFRGIFPGLQSFDPMHYAAYFILALTVAYAFGAYAFTLKGCLWNVALCVIYGLSDEWHQAFVPNRSPDPLDLWHDAVGAVSACAILLLIKLFRQRNRSA